MNKKQVIKRAVESLKKLFSEYKGKGVISIYIWGSLLTDDFDLDKSDIDSVAIVENDFDPEIGKEMREILSIEKKSGLKLFKINYLFLDELGGNKPRSMLAKVIHPNLILQDFNNWRYVCGKKFSRSDFPRKEWSYEMAINHMINKFDKFQLPRVKSGDYSDIMYICKNLFKVCHSVNQINHGKHIFSYDNLLKYSVKEDKELIELLLKIRNKNWSERVFKKELSKIIKHVKKLKKSIKYKVK